MVLTSCGVLPKKPRRAHSFFFAPPVHHRTYLVRFGLQRHTKSAKFRYPGKSTLKSTPAIKIIPTNELARNTTRRPTDFRIPRTPETISRRTKNQSAIQNERTTHHGYQDHVRSHHLPPGWIPSPPLPPAACSPPPTSHISHHTSRSPESLGPPDSMLASLTLTPPPPPTGVTGPTMTT